MLKAYLAGPDVFLPNAAAHAAEKIALCAVHGILGVSPFNPNLDLALPAALLWRQIFADDMRMMHECDIIIANLTPFRGVSADAGTLVELGWFLGAGKPCWGYSNDPAPFAVRVRSLLEHLPDALPTIEVEDFGLADNLMIEGALAGNFMRPPDKRARPFDSLEIFELTLRRIKG